MDSQRISSVKNLEFPPKGKEKLTEWYNMSARNIVDEYGDGTTYFMRYYKRMLQDVKDKEDR